MTIMDFNKSHERSEWVSDKDKALGVRETIPLGLTSSML
jgi:hypothetical protein